MHEMDVKSSVLQRVSRNDVTTAGRPTDRPTDRPTLTARRPTNSHQPLAPSTHKQHTLTFTNIPSLRLHSSSPDIASVPALPDEQETTHRLRIRPPAFVLTLNGRRAPIAPQLT
ncbi:hypothetical protein M513_11353 [Trichuris suis]|uniref:Uncharacterized protein n=1 Tax=Trichuris suis TaxID=68888 RepID=A0A085LS57_9BILA|nr:hypothetical protein M513_11353 [Trichuris suis]